MLRPIPPKHCDFHLLERSWRMKWEAVPIFTGREFQPVGGVRELILADIHLRHRLMRSSALLPAGGGRRLQERGPTVPTPPPLQRLGLLRLPAGATEPPVRAGRVLTEARSADAVRFATAMQPGWPPGPSRLQGAERLARKTWNLLRFACIHLQGDEPLSPDPPRSSDMDRWLLHRLNAVTAQVNDDFDQHRLARVCAGLQHLIRTEFGSWYVEFLRRRLHQDASRQCLRYALIHAVHLLHPLMPHITEEVFSRLGPGTGRMLLQLPYPEYRSELVFPHAAERVQTLRSLVRSTRRLTSRLKSPGQGSPEIILQGGTGAQRRWISGHAEDFRQVAGVRALNVEAPPGRADPRQESDSWSIRIPVTDPGAHAALCFDLRRQLDRLNQRIHRMQRKLTDRDFMQTLSAATARRWKKRLASDLRRREALLRTLALLADTGEAGEGEGKT